MGKAILCLDFDGVLHSYVSGWKGARNIPDPPVPGALEFLSAAADCFEVHILSSRSHQWFGRRAMKRWLRHYLIKLTADGWDHTPQWLRDRIARTAFADPWPDEAAHAIDHLLSGIKWPLHKPPAQVTIDDRALTFTGEWPSIWSLENFKPWNKRPVAQATQPHQNSTASATPPSSQDQSRLRGDPTPSGPTDNGGAA